MHEDGWKFTWTNFTKGSNNINLPFNNSTNECKADIALDTLTDFKAGWSPEPWRTNEEGHLLIN